MSRYEKDVLAPGWQRAGRPVTRPVTIFPDLVVEEPTSGFVGSVVRWENGMVVLEDRKGKRRSFPLGPGFWIDGKPVELVLPKRAVNRPTHTASGSRVSAATSAKVALPSRIFVEGKHDAELVEKIWGDDLRHVGVVVELLNGADLLPEIVASFAPEPGRRLGILLDHLVPDSKESRIAAEVAGPDVFVTGHQFIDIWQAIKPSVLGIPAWPDVPRGEDWKEGTCRRLGWPSTDTGRVWTTILSRVQSWKDLDVRLIAEVEKLIDFVTVEDEGEH